MNVRFATVASNFIEKMFQGEPVLKVSGPPLRLPSFGLQQQSASELNKLRAGDPIEPGNINISLLVWDTVFNTIATQLEEHYQFRDL